MCLKISEALLLDVKNNILRSGAMGTLAQMIYMKVPALMDLPTSGLFNLPLMWSFERRMTIQHFSHLVEQEVETGNVPHLSELLKSVRVFFFHSSQSTHITSFL